MHPQKVMWIVSLRQQDLHKIGIHHKIWPWKWMPSNLNRCWTWDKTNITITLTLNKFIIPSILYYSADIFSWLSYIYISNIYIYTYIVGRFLGRGKWGKGFIQFSSHQIIIHVLSGFWPARWQSLAPYTWEKHELPGTFTRNEFPRKLFPRKYPPGD